MSSRVKKSFIFTGKILSVFLACIFLFSSCDNFLTDNEEFKSLMEEEVHDSTAKELNVTVQAVPGQGNASCSAKTVKLDVAFQVSFEPDTSYGSFNVWKAYANYEKENQRELGAEDIFFSSATSLTTEVRILKDCGDIRIVPYCTKHPQVNIIMPDGFVNPGTITPSGQYQMEAGKEYSVTVQTSTDYGFVGWRIFTKDGETEHNLIPDEDYTSIEYEPEVSKNSKNLGSTRASISIILLKADFGKSIYITPILYEYPGVMIQFPNEYEQSDVGTLSPIGEKKICLGIEYNISLVTKNTFGFNSWKIYSVSSDNETTDLFVNGKVTEAGTEIIEAAEGETTVSKSALSDGTVTTSVNLTLLKNIDENIYVEPLVYAYPRLFTSLGSKYENLSSTELAKIGSISPETGESGKAIISGNEYKVTLKTTESYGFEKWTFYKYNSDKTKTTLDSSMYTAAMDEPIFSATGTTATMTVTFNDSLTGNVWIEPILSGYPEAYIKLSDTAAGSITPSGLQKIMLNRDYAVSLQTLSQFGFSGWSFYDNPNEPRTEIPVCIDGDTAPGGNYIYITSDSSLDSTDDLVKNASLVMFNMIKDTSSSSGSVKASAIMRMQKDMGYVCIEGNIVTHPNIDFTVPLFNNVESGSITPLGQVQESSDTEFTVSTKLGDSYSFDGWLLRDSADVDKTVSDYFDVIAESVNSYKSEAIVVLKIKTGKDVDGFRISAKTKYRPKVSVTSPASNATSVMRTSPITIVFSRPINSEAVGEKYKDFFKIESRASMTDAASSDVSGYFKTPTISAEGNVVTFEPNDNKNDANWLPPTSFITVTVSGMLKDKDGVMLGKDYVFNFTLGTSGDSEGPIVSSATLTSGSTTLTAASSTQAYWGDWEPSNNPTANHVYADSFRTKGSASDTFTATITASDDTTGNTGISGYSVIQRLMYVSKGGRLPNTSRLADSDMTLFAEDGTWNGLSGCLKADYEKEISLSTSGNGSSGSGSFSLSSEFKDSSNKPVDGIYMLELTAKDGLGNKSGNPARYFVVRDTTAPNAAENEDKVYIASGGTNVNGTRYFKYSSESLRKKFVVKGTFADFGTQGQPWTASEPSSITPYYALSSSETTFKKVTNYINGTVTIPDECFDSDKELYVWVKLKDAAGNMSEEFCATGAVVGIDVTAPTIQIAENENYSFFTSQTGDLGIYIKNDSEKVYFNISDGSSGLKTVTFGEKNSSPSAFNYQNNNGKQVAKDKDYSVVATDAVGNSAQIDFIVRGLDSYETPSLTFEKIYDSDLEGNTGYDVTYKGRYRNGYNYEAEVTYNLSGTNGDVTAKFILGSEKVPLSDHTLKIEKIDITDYEIYKVKENSFGGYDNNGLIFSRTGISPAIHTVEIPSECSNSGKIRIVVKGNIVSDLYGRTETKDYVYADELARNISVQAIAFNGIKEESASALIYLDCWAPYIDFTSLYPQNLGKIVENGMDVYLISGVSGSAFQFSGNFYDKTGWYLYENLTGVSTPSFLTYGKVMFRIENEDFPDHSYFNDIIFDQTQIYLKLGDNKVTVFDGLGNENSVIIRCVADDIGPLISVDASYYDDATDTYWTTGSDPITVTVTDDAGIRECIYNDGSNYYRLEGGSFELTGTADKTWHVYAKDTNGNETKQDIKVKIDRDVPAITISEFIDEKTVWNSNYEDTKGTNGSNGVKKLLKGTNYGVISTANSSDAYPQGYRYTINQYYPRGFYSGDASVIFTVKEASAGLKEGGVEILKNGSWVPVTNVSGAKVAKGTKSNSAMQFLTTTTEDYVTIRATDLLGRTSTITVKNPLIKQGTYYTYLPDIEITSTTANTLVSAKGTSNASYYSITKPSGEKAKIKISCVSDSSKVGFVEFAQYAKSPYVNVRTNFTVGTSTLELDSGTYYIYVYDLLGLGGETSYLQYYMINVNDWYEFESGKPTYSTWSGDWVVDSSVAHGGSKSLKSAEISHSQTSTQTITANCSNVSFWYKVSSELNYDYFQFSVDDTVVIGDDKKLSGTKDWTQYTWTGARGQHVLKWEYIKDSSQSEGEDCAWIDDLVIY